MSRDQDPSGEFDDSEPLSGERIDLSEIIGAIAAPFADIDVPKGFESLLKGNTVIPQLLMHCLSNSMDPRRDFQNLKELSSRHIINTLLVRQRGIRGDPNRVTFENYTRTSLSLRIDDRKTLVDRLVAIDDASRLAVMVRNGHTWLYEKEYKPYEHPGVESLGIRMTTNPLSCTSEATLSMIIHPEVVDDHMATSLVDALIQVQKVGQRILDYGIDSSDEEYYNTRIDKGKGVIHFLNGGAEVNIELNGDRLTMTHRTKSMQAAIKDAIEGSADEEQKDKARSRIQSEFAKLVDAQLDFITREFPAFAEHVAFIWDNPLPYDEIKPVLGARASELGLFDEIKDETEEQGGVPDIVIDARQRELYLHTARRLPDTTFGMVGGLDDEVKKLNNAIMKAMNPKRYEQAGLDPRAVVLLMGPPGTGKTMLAEAVAQEVGGIFLAARGSDLMSMWAGEAEKNVASLFDLVEVLGKDHKVVLFLDEIEAIAPSRGGQHMMEHERKVTAEFLSALNRKYPNAIIIGATNNPSHADPAVTRPGRFTTHISIGQPNELGRKHILENWVGYFKQRALVEVFNGLDIDGLAKLSEGLNGADLRSIVETALETAVESAIEEERDIKPIGTVAMAGFIEHHIASTAVRFEDYLNDGRPSQVDQPMVLVVKHQGQP